MRSLDSPLRVMGALSTAPILASSGDEYATALAAEPVETVVEAPPGPWYPGRTANLYHRRRRLAGQRRPASASVGQLTGAKRTLIVSR